MLDESCKIELCYIRVINKEVFDVHKKKFGLLFPVSYQNGAAHQVNAVLPASHSIGLFKVARQHESGKRSH